MTTAFKTTYGPGELAQAIINDVAQQAHSLRLSGRMPARVRMSEESYQTFVEDAKHYLAIFDKAFPMTPKIHGLPIRRDRKWGGGPNVE